MTHKDLKVWNDSIELTKEVYELTSNLPKQEMYGLTSQMRRCAISIPSNISEGAARSSTKEFIRFIDIARASLAELDTQIIISKKLNFVSEDSKIETKIVGIKFMLTALKKSLSRKLKS